MLITYCLRKNVQIENASTYLRFVNVTCHKSQAFKLCSLKVTFINSTNENNFSSNSKLVQKGQFIKIYSYSSSFIYQCED